MVIATLHPPVESTPWALSYILFSSTSRVLAVHRACTVGGQAGFRFYWGHLLVCVMSSLLNLRSNHVLGDRGDRDVRESLTKKRQPWDETV